MNPDINKGTEIKRRTALQVLAGLSAGGTAAMAAEQHTHTPDAPVAGPQPKSPVAFNAHAYQLLRSLCQIIIPADDHDGGALASGVPEFIDLLASENPDYQHQLSGGLMWLDATCQDRYGNPFLNCGAADQKQILDWIAFRGNAAHDPGLLPGIHFFALLRDLTLDGFFTSRTGIDYLGYRGNSALPQFTGCTGEPGMPK